MWILITVILKITNLEANTPIYLKPIMHDTLESCEENLDKIFLDLKFHDITNTVLKSCAAASDLGVWMLNVHSSGGKSMMANSKIHLLNKNFTTKSSW